MTDMLIFLELITPLIQVQVDTSDGAYERRHKKYETFERRQRLREKEKLKHEQYKLKERVEQLRIMDASAFLALPASDFSPAPGVQEDDACAGTLAAAHVNGANAHNEGERRRKEMLDIALSLEARFRVLLPPDRIRKSQSRPTMREDNAITPTTSVFQRSASDAEITKEEEAIFADSHNLRQDRIKAKSAEKDSAYESPALASVSRASERFGVTSLSPIQKPEQRHSVSRSPSPVISPCLAEEPVVSPAHPIPERPVLYYIGMEEHEEHLGPQSEEEVNPPSLPHEQFISAPDQIVEPVEVHQSTNSQTRSSVPPQEHRPLLDVQPLNVPEVDPTGGINPVEQEALKGFSEPFRPISLPEAHQHGSSPMYIDVGRLPEPSASLHLPLPPPIATLSNAFPSQFQKTEAAPRRRPGRPPKNPERKSRLLELAEAVQSITMAPPTKRKKTSHYDDPSVKLPVPSPVSYETVEPNQEFMVPISTAPSERQSRSPPSEQSLETRDTVGLLAPPYPSISVAGSRRSSVRRGVTIAEYQSDTGELRWTTTPLLVAAVRGGQRQTQRHQMAFGVKVPDQVADPYDFWLPDEYLPEEELQKYDH